FSSRRRHTRFSRDWSSDVCSSDLLLFSCSKESPKPIEDEVGNPPEEPGKPGAFINLGSQLTATSIQESTFAQDEAGNEYAYAVRSEERRVGKGCGYVWRA